MEEEKWHGTKYGYDHHKCRCDDCRKARKVYQDAAIARRYAAPKDPNDPRHGKYSFYTGHACRCELCKAAAVEVNKKYHPRKRPPAEERFWAKVNKTESCWLWTGKPDTAGYGVFGSYGKVEQAHRFSYKLHGGEIPEGMYIDHMCHQPACVRPEHLRTATNKQNQENLSGPISTNTSGVRGVHWNEKASRWVGRVVHNGKGIYVGRFADIKEAEAAVIAKRNELFTHNILDRKAA